MDPNTTNTPVPETTPSTPTATQAPTVASVAATMPTPTPAAQSAPVTPTQALTTAPTPTPAPTTAPTPATTQAPATTSGCKCPDINIADWDKQKKQLNKAFYKTFSPRLLFYPFSFAIDKARAETAATRKGYQEVQYPMLLDYNPKMFWSTLLVEVANAKADDPSIVSFVGKNLYTKVSRKPWKQMREDIAELTKELGAAPKELYIWYTSCPACTDKKEAKCVLIAVV